MGAPAASRSFPMTDLQRRDAARGILFMVIAALLFGCVDALSKLLAPTQSVGQIVWARYALAFPLLLSTTRPSEWRRLFNTAAPRLQIARGLTPILLSGGMVLGVRYLPLADATAILFAGPFLVVALSAPMLGERVPAASWIGVAIGFVAVLVVARPGLDELSKYAIFPALSAVFFAVQQLLTRRLGTARERAQTTLIWTLAIGALISTPVAAVTWEPLGVRGWVLMLALGSVFAVSQLLYIRSLAYAQVSVLAPFNYVQIVSAALIGLVVFGDVPDRWTLVGIAMIIAAGVYIVRRRT
jgi:drug/metabolite transporter (DMT)-like permease